MARSIDFTAALDDGRTIITQSRLIRSRCEATGMKSRQLAYAFFSTHPFRARRSPRGASEVIGIYGAPRRQIWRHRPTNNRWVVVINDRGAPAAAAGPFSATEWDPVLQDYVPLDGHHALDWLREHIEEFEREDR